MPLSPYQSLFRLYFLEFLRALLASVQELLQLAKTLTSTWLPQRYRPETNASTNVKKLCPYHCSPDIATSAFIDKILPHSLQIYTKETLAHVSGPPQGLSLRVNRPECAGLLIFDKATGRTPPILDFTPKDGVPTLQHAYWLFACLIHFSLHSARRIVVPAFLSRRLIRVSQWLTTVPVRAHANPDRWNSELEGVKSFIANDPTPTLAYGIPNLLQQGSSTPPTSVLRIPGAGALYETNFTTANPYLLGYIEEPKGRSLRTGGYSDVWRCKARILTPSVALHIEVAVKVLRAVQLGDQNEADATKRKRRQKGSSACTLVAHPWFMGTSNP
ncbi:hypothetical protein FS837_006212 [Tulasnella sp. UAMH 9824]|nr:hypothetical protein FS837_006212 [Tulasnella sp. UAMH 9824]